MFKLKNRLGNIRVGTILINHKKAETPCFFVTSNFGGGGTNVSRLLVYSDLFVKTKSQLLMNYYYLDINSDLNPRFDTKLIRKLQDFKDINQFIQYVKKEYTLSNPKKAIDDYKYNSSIKWFPIILLDSGSGNILRGKIKRKELTHKNYKEVYKKLISNYFDFAVSNKFDVIVAMDFAGKNTLKAGEMRDKDYVKRVLEFSSNVRNFELLKLTLDYMKKNKTIIEVLAPVHGTSPKEYEDYIRNIIKIEKNERCKFSGFAIGGLGNPNKINKSLWDIPDECNGKVKAALYLTKIASIIRTVLDDEKDERPLHILGSASPYNLIPLIYFGCDTFDCHSAWRRASDGNDLSKNCIFNEKLLKKYLNEGKIVSFSKMLVPLLDSKLQSIAENKGKFLEFVDLNSYTFKCNCVVCSSVKTIDLKKLYCGSEEQNYYAKILIYLHNVLQYDHICEKFKSLRKISNVKDFIGSLPESSFKENMNRVLFP